MAKQQEEKLSENQKKCGIVMPISPHPDYSHDHWKDVLNIISEAINETSFKPSLVSDDEAIGLIHERIVTNIYNNEMIVCDVSSKNPNVMFELGLRLAFDKPVIIVKDDKTTYSFDTGLIEHLTYPSSLRFGDIVVFKKELAKKIEATFKRASETQNFSPFLKSFGKTIVPAKIEGEEITETKFLIDQIYSLKDDLKRMRFELRNPNSRRYTDDKINFNRGLVNKYFNDIISTRNSVSQNELLEYTKERVKELNINISEDDIAKLVSDYWRDFTGEIK